MKKKIIIMLVLICLVIIAIIILLLGNKPSHKNKIVGSWTTDGITIYEFKKNNTGKLIVSLGEYPFTYKITDNTLEINFKDDKVTDSKFTYSIENGKLILNGDNGTFTFKKK